MDSSADVLTALGTEHDGNLPGVHVVLPVKPQILRLQVTYLVLSVLRNACVDVVRFGCKLWDGERYGTLTMCLWVSGVWHDLLSLQYNCRSGIASCTRSVKCSGVFAAASSACRIRPCGGPGGT